MSDSKQKQEKKGGPQILTEELPSGLSHQEFRHRGANLPANSPKPPSNEGVEDDAGEEGDEEN
jgi:hypothetical protein